MQQTFTDTTVPLKFYEFPPKVIVSVSPELELFLYETGIKANSHEHHEITRQVFDYIDFGFTEFCNLMLTLPLFRLLTSFNLDHMKYTDTNGNINSLALNLKRSTQKYGICMYKSCEKVGMFDGERTPYIIETIHNDLILLHNSYK